MNVFAVVLFSEDRARFYDAVSFAAGARAQGKSVLFFLRGPALRAYVSGDWLETSKPLVFPDDPDQTLRFLRDKGKVTLYACSAWVRLWNLDNAAVLSRVDAVVGLNAFLSQSEGGTIIYI